jgi:hypothetical protein
VPNQKVSAGPTGRIAADSDAYLGGLTWVDVVVKIALGLSGATMPFFGFWSLALPGGST